MRGKLLTALGLLASVAVLTSGCGSTSTGSSASGGDVQVVAAESFWGSIAGQLGGDKVRLQSVISSPATDPHDFEPTAADARSLAGAQMVIENGIGYDPWAAKLVAANPAEGRVVLNVGELVGLEPGANPHRWYSPRDVQLVVDAIVRGFDKLRPQSSDYFAQQKAHFETSGLARYKRLLSTIRRKYHGVPVGASESVFAPLAQALGLRLLTPPRFLNAITEGTEPTAADRTTIDRQIAKKQIKVWVFNSQNSTPDVQRITDAARKRGIPVTMITETPEPASASFQDWQSRQLAALGAALAQATGR